MLKVGYTPCTQDLSHGTNIAQVLEEAMAEAQLAEKCGFDSCFFTEHHQQADYYIPNPLMLALAAGQKTQTLKVGTCVL